VAEARRAAPESEAWLRLVEAALTATEDGAAWAAAVPEPRADQPVKAPLLSRTDIAIDGRAARQWVRRLLKLAAQADGRRVDGVRLLEAALCQDDAAIDALAASTGGDPQALHVVAQIAAVPLLHACARGLAARIPPSWWEGYCPLCGAWPALAEYTGLERKRQLRCGRCGTGWAIPVLRCAFCDETDHANLGYLTPEEGDQMRKVEVCNTCKGYLKGLTTVRALAPWAILLDDLMSVHLDVAALERGYERPGRPGYALDAKIVVRRQAPRTLLGFALGPQTDGA
jgi:FdhE protein